MNSSAQLHSNNHEAKMKEIEEFLRKQPAETSMEYSSQDIQKLVDKGSIPRDLGEWFLKCLKEKEAQHAQLQEFIKDHPEIPDGEHCRQFFKESHLTLEESAELYKNMSLSGQLLVLLLKNRNLLNALSKTEKPLQEILEPLFKNIDESSEFGIVRFVADQMNHLPVLLGGAKIEQVSQSEFLIRTEKNLDKSEKKRLQFTFPITAQNIEDAREISERVKDKLLGIRHKMWQACWLYGNKVKKTQFTAPIIELMKSCYPDRGHFSAEDKKKFYEELSLLKQAEFALIGTVLKKSGKKGQTKLVQYKYNIPILRVGGALGKPGILDDVPNEVLIDLCAITPTPPPDEKMQFVAAPIKKTTLELAAKDCSLAFYLQVRKNQLWAGKKTEKLQSYSFKIDNLIVQAGLQPTFEANPTMARKRLVEKLERAQEKGVLRSFERIDETIRVCW